jgi:hypothetical protein
MFGLWDRESSIINPIDNRQPSFYRLTTLKECLTSIYRSRKIPMTY